MHMRIHIHPPYATCDRRRSTNRDEAMPVAQNSAMYGPAAGHGRQPERSKYLPKGSM